MNKWIERFSTNFATQTEKAKCANCTNCTAHKNLIEELNHLNQRWQKADALEKAGHFVGRSPEYEEKICYELRQICGRATDIWETLSKECPESLKELYLLEPGSMGGNE